MAATRWVFVGRVQRVGFRYTMQRACQRHGVRGWVRNRPDGTVEAVTEASAEAVEGALEELRARLGANIGDTQSEPAESPGLRGFEIRR